MRSQQQLEPWHTKIGTQRDWVWRGWQIRYTYIRPTSPPLEEGGRLSKPPLPVLFIHGFGSALGQWRSNLMPLGQHHCVYALDLLGFGASEKAATHYNIGLWADLVYDFWRTFIGQPAAIVGHSLGALVALSAVAAHPEMAQGLALLTLPDVAEKQPPAWARSIERIFASPLLLWPLFQIVRHPKLLRWVLSKIYTIADLVDEDLVSIFSTPAKDRGAIQVFYRLSQARSHDDYSPKVKELLPALQMPILLLWGSKDSVIPLSGGRVLVKLNTNLRLVELEGVGHCAYDECPERVNQEILYWAESCVSFYKQA